MIPHVADCAAIFQLRINTLSFWQFPSAHYRAKTATQLDNNSRPYAVTAAQFLTHVADAKSRSGS
jgi:hypothetical protein